MAKPIFKKEKKDLDNQEGASQLSTEEEVRILKEELAKKEKELKSLKPKEEAKDILQTEEPKEKEIKKEQEKIRISPEKPGKVKLPSTKTTKPSKAKDEEMDADLKQIMSMDKPKQVKTLVYLAFKKGVNYAASIASQLKEPYLLDEFHDTLVDNLYDLLKKKKKI